MTQTLPVEAALEPAPPPKTDLFRAIYPGFEIRDAGEQADGFLAILSGHFAVFDEWTEICSEYEGHFLERVCRGAFKKTFQEQAQRMKVLFQHGFDPTVGRKPLGPILKLEEDEVGAAYEVGLIDTVYNRDLLPGLRTAGLYGASFRFSMIQEAFVRRPAASPRNPDRLPERSLKEVKVVEFGPVTFPAYLGATAGARSITDEIRELAAIQPAGDRQAGPPARGNPTSEEEISQEVRDRIVIGERREARRYDRIVAAINQAVWVMEPNALQTLLDIVAERHGGYRASQEEIAERIGVRQEPDPVPDESTVAVIRVHGTIAPRAEEIENSSSSGVGIDRVLSEFRAAMADPAKTAVMLDIDSPGGAAQGIPEAFAEIRTAKDKTVVAQVTGMAASGALWLASAADEIVVTPSGQMGSVGAYVAHQDLSEQMAMKGIKTTFVYAGKYKIERNPFEPLSDDAKADMQERVDEVYDDFVAALAKGRDTKVATVRSDFGQGRMLTAKKAVAVGMADTIATFQETVARLEKESVTRSERADGEPEDAPVVEAAETETPHPDETGRSVPSEPLTEEEWRAWISRI